jgi:Uma2 family endonuclease
MSKSYSTQFRLRDDRLDVEVYRLQLGALHHKLSDDEFFDFCQRNSYWRIELSKEGEMIFMVPVGSEGGHRNFNLNGEFYAWVKADGTGVGFDSSTGFKLPNGAKRSPDLAWILKERWEAIPKRLRKKFAPICPDFVVELRSESDVLDMLKEKMEEYLENGAQLGWLIDPLEKKVYVYQPDVRVKVLKNPKSLSGEPLLHGLTLSLKEILH